MGFERLRSTGRGAPIDPVDFLVRTDSRSTISIDLAQHRLMSSSFVYPNLAQYPISSLQLALLLDVRVLAAHSHPTLANPRHSLDSARLSGSGVAVIENEAVAPVCGGAGGVEGVAGHDGDLRGSEASGKRANERAKQA